MSKEEYEKMRIELVERNPIIKCSMFDKEYRLKELTGGELVVTDHPRMVLVDKFGSGCASNCLKEFLKNKDLKEIELFV